jgi:osmotically-inducible protein OsmY
MNEDDLMQVLTEDEVLQRNVLEELEWDPRINAADIGVTVRHGVVTLTGHVGSHAEKVAAEHAALGVKGVRAIAQDIEVQLPNEKKRSDTDIAERAVKILEWDQFVPHERIAVEVANGWLTLSGGVGWQYEKTAAEAAVRALSGVCGISNEITVKPQVVATDVRHNIEQAFKRNAELEASHVTVTAEGDTITLSGTVRTCHEREMAEGAVWSAPGIKHVRNEITVQP